MSPDANEDRIWRNPPLWSIKETDPRTRRLIAKLEQAGNVSFTDDQKTDLVRILNMILVSSSQRFSRKKLVRGLERIRRHAEALADALEPRDSLGWEALGMLGYYLQLKNLDRENLIFECTVLAEAVKLITKPETALQKIHEHSDDLPDSLLAEVEKLQMQLQQLDVSKGGRPPDWMSRFLIPALYRLYREAGGKANLPYWNDYKKEYVGTFLDLVDLLLYELHRPAQSRTALAKQILRILST